MQKLPIGRLFMYIFVMTMATEILGYAVCAKTSNYIATSLVMLVSLTIGMTLVLRWWIPLVRATGVPTTKPKPAQWLIMFSLLASLNVAVVIEHFVYQSTKNRFAEVSAAIATIVPIGCFVVSQSHRWTTAITAKQFQIHRLNYYLQLGLPALFGFNVIMMLNQRHVDESFDGLREWIFPLFFAYFVFTPFSITMLRRRYIEAKALKNSSPPDHWQAYNDTLARNE